MNIFAFIGFVPERVLSFYTGQASDGSYSTFSRGAIGTLSPALVHRVISEQFLQSYSLLILAKYLIFNLLFYYTIFFLKSQELFFAHKSFFLTLSFYIYYIIKKINSQIFYFKDKKTQDLLISKPCVLCSILKI